MATQASDNSSAITIIGSEFVCPQSSDLTIIGDTVKDTNGNKVFKVKTPLFGLHNKRILVDPNDSPILTMKMKVLISFFTLITMESIFLFVNFELNLGCYFPYMNI